MTTHPFLSDDYHIRWSALTPDCVESDIKQGIALAEERLEAIRKLDASEVTLENTFLALESATEELGRGWGRLNHLDSVTAIDGMRDALNAMLPEVSAFYSSISLDAEIWVSLKAFRDSDAGKGLSALEQRFVDETCIEFVSSGADLPADKKARVAEIDSKLSAVTQKFAENVVDSTDDWELVVDDEARLAGLPKMVKEGARLSALEKGEGTEEAPKWRFTLQYPSMAPVMQFADDDSLRKDIWLGMGQIGYKGDWDNTKLIWEILELRQEKAELLGKDNFPDMILEHRMAKSGQGAMDFTESMHAKVESHFLKDQESLKEYVSEKTGSEVRLLEPWETGYWVEKRRKEEYDFDSEALRPYFSVENVMAGMFAITSKIFGIKIEERETVFGEDKEGAVQVWHEDCLYYDVFDEASGDLLGSFYADWHPRQGKRGGAWMNTLKTGLPPMDGKARVPHLGLMVGNMTKPVGKEPALLAHREVETIFHEFGHLLHHVLGEAEIKSLSGMNVPWDFVELPSQIMENYCWERVTLDMFAKHYETGEVIPDALFDKMIAARNYMSGTHNMRQLGMQMLDLEIHLHGDKYKGMDLVEMEQQILERYRTDMATESPSILRKFNHLFSGAVAYASGYYSYKWAEVLDADAFTRFKKEGVLNAETGKSFRDEILGAGNTRPADESYRQFMGRDPELNPVLERAGMV
ncbi:MAG: M3 family metallopeptidase [Akkermansiaceae bacterium]